MSSAFGWAAAALLMGCHGSSSTSAAAGPSVQIFRVTTAQIVERPVPSVIPLTGSLTAEVRTDLTANATGKVARTFVERGQKVQQGTVLPLLDVRSAAASAAEAQEESASAPGSKPTWPSVRSRTRSRAAALGRLSCTTLWRCVTLSGWGRAHDAFAKPAHRIACWGLVALAATGTVAALVLLFRLL